MSRILVVDDDPDIRALLGVFLKTAGHEVEFAVDGTSGVEAAAKQLPDLIVTDFQMPRMDGFGLFNAVRSRPAAAKVPIVMVTAHNSREMMQKALSLGLDDFLGKPITRDELLRVVGERLRPATSAAATGPQPQAAPPAGEFFGSVMCCAVGRLEGFALALKKEELDELLDEFVRQARRAVQADGGWVIRRGFHHVFAVFEESAGKAHALRALHSALRTVLAAQRLKPWAASRFAGRDLPEFLVALGVHSGNVKSANGDFTGEGVEIAQFLAESIPDLKWSVAASRASAKAANFEFLAGRGAQLRMPRDNGTLKAVEVRGLGTLTQPTAQQSQAATLIEAAVNRNATLVTFAAAVPKPQPQAPAPAQPAGAPPRAPAAPATPKPAPAVSDLVPGYSTVRKLADNGIVAVYLAQPVDGGPQQVVKTVLINDDKKQTKRPHLQKFVAQYAGIGQVEHPNIARVTGQGLTATHLYVVQEYCTGGDLRNLIAEKMVADDALKALLRITAALRAAHQKGFVHGDLKPANVMIRADGSFAIIDFALARVVEYAVGEGESGVLVRSPDYLSPEMINGQPADVQSDLYTLGLLLHEMLTGQRAYANSDLSRVMMDHLTAPVPKLPEGHQRFQPLLDKLMDKARDKRFASVTEMMAFLAQAKLNA